MNEVKAIGDRIYSVAQRIISFFCDKGAFYPPDDKSGVVVDGKTQTVLMDLSGKYYYLNEKGEKVYFDPKEAEFVNVNEKHLESAVKCFTTPDGDVQVLSMMSVNDNLEVLKENHYVQRSSDAAYTVGHNLSSIPDDWEYRDCLEGKTPKYMSNVSYCLSDGTNTIYVKGLALITDSLETAKVSLTVLESNTTDYSVGDKLEEIPEGYAQVKCECNCCGGE